MESNLKLSKIPRLHGTIRDASLELIPELFYQIQISTKLSRFVLASTHIQWPRFRLLDQVNDLDENSSENQLSETCHF